MARKTIVDEELKFTVRINGDEAQKELFDLEKATRELTKTNKNLKAERDKLKALGKEESAEYKKLTASIKENNATINANKDRMKVLQDQIGITSLSMGQLRRKASELRLQLYNLVPGSAEYKRYEADLKAVDARIKELRTNAAATRSSIGRLADGFNRYAALGASLIATGTGMVLSLQRMIDFNAKLSDAQTNVMKTTGMTKDQVDELTESFGMLKTRTARVELLKLAEEAGRLGITGVQDVQRFVEVANKMKVALGDDLSEEAIREVGKITSIFKVGEQTGRDFAEAMESVGSAINEVAASGANQASYLVDFLQRTAGIAQVAEISADQMIGLAAAFDEVGVTQEIAGTAMNKTLLSMYDNVAQFANMAGVPIEKFRKLLKEDANEAFITFVSSLSNSNMDAEQLVQSLNGIDIGGTRGAAAMLSLASGIDTVRKRQDTANKALYEATSLMDEYNLKNNNLAAILEKVQKKLIGIFTSEKIVNGLTSIVGWFSKFIGASVDAEGKVTRFREGLIFLLKAIIAIIAGILSYNAAIKISAFLTSRAAQATTLYSLAQKAALVTTRTLKAAKLLLSAAYLVLTGNITRATAAMRLFSITTKLTPWGLLAATIAAVGTAYYLYSKNATGAAKAQKDLNEVRNQVAKNVAREVSEIENLLKIAKDENQAKEKRLKAIKRLNDISPEYLSNLSLENINTAEATKSINNYIRALEKKALAQAIQSKQQEALNRLVESNLEAEDRYQNMVNNIDDNIQRQRAEFDRNKRVLGSIGEFDEENQRRLLQERAKTYYDDALEANKSEFEEYTKKLSQAIGGSSSMTDILAGIDEPTSEGGSTSGSVSTASAVDSSKNESDLRRIQEENNRLKASLINDSFQKEIALEEANHQEKLARLREQMVSEANLKGMTPEARAIALEKNQALNDQIILQEEIHQNKLGTIIQQGLQEDFQQKQEQFEREKVLRETRHNEELAALGNDEEAKKALQERFKREELDREARHLEEMVAEMNAILESGQFEGFSLDLISEEEKQALLDFLEQANLEASKLYAILSGDSTGGLGTQRGEGVGSIDILGFSVDEWDSLFENIDTTEGKIQAVAMAIGAMTQIYSQYSDFVAAKQQNELREFERAQEQKRRSLERQLDRGMINQRQYDQAIEAMDRERDKKQAEMEYKKAKRDKEMAIANIVMNTAMGVAKTLGETGFFGIPLSAIVGALGAAQLAIAAATPLPSKGYEEGYYPVQREQDGKVFNATYGGTARSGLVDKPTHFLAGEGGKNFPEMIIDGSSWKKMDPGVKESLQREISRVRGYAAGYYKDSASGNRVSSESTSNEEAYLMMVAALNRNSNLMEKLEKTGLPAFLKRDTELARNIKEDIDEYTRLRNANKLG